LDSIYDPLDPDQARDPWQRLDEVRRRCPVSEVRPGTYFLARDQDARATLRNHSALSNAGNFTLEPTDPDEALPLTRLDPPRHTKMRRLLLEAFTPRSIERLRPDIEAIAARLIDAFEDTDRIDLIAAFAGPLPATVISHLIGVPEQDRAQFLGWTQEMTSKLPMDSKATSAWPQFQAYLAEFIAARRSLAEDARDDLTTRLIHAEIEGERLTDDELLITIWQLLVAGIETTARLISLCVYELLRQPELWARVCVDPDLSASAIEESLRHDPPLQWVMRSCNADLSLGAVTIPTQSRIMIGLAAANRDAEAWRDPDAFILGRERADHHLAFGYGIHFCLGAPLARMEGVIALETLAARLPTLSLAPNFSYEPGRSPMFLGPTSLHVQWSSD
jgi:cytochrome P450